MWGGRRVRRRRLHVAAVVSNVTVVVVAVVWRGDMMIMRIMIMVRMGWVAGIHNMVMVRRIVVRHRSLTQVWLLMMVKTVLLCVMMTSASWPATTAPA